MIINYLVETDDMDGFLERYEPLNLGFKAVDSDDESGSSYELYNTDLSGKEHKIHPYKRGPLSDTEKEIFCEILEDALDSGEKLVKLFNIFYLVEMHLKKELNASNDDGMECPHCGVNNEI